METTAIAPLPAASAARSASGFEELNGDAFFKLLIAQLANQDPLEPTSNQELLQQISSIRDIELSSALTRSLRTLVDQQRFGSAATLIGQFVSGPAAHSEDGASPVAGVVSGVRFNGSAGAVLLLDGGGELPLEQVESVMPARLAAERLIGRTVTGLDRANAASPALVEGIVTGVRADTGDRIVLELDTGVELRLTDIVSAE